MCACLCIEHIHTYIHIYIYIHKHISWPERCWISTVCCNLIWENRTGLRFLLLIWCRLNRHDLTPKISGNSINGGTFNGWFISWKISWKWMMTGGTPIYGNPHAWKDTLGHLLVTQSWWAIAGSAISMNNLQRPVLDVRQRTMDISRRIGEFTQQNRGMYMGFS